MGFRPPLYLLTHDKKREKQKLAYKKRKKGRKEKKEKKIVNWKGKIK